ncbi:high affinity immunoglobulin alpha and immunoglobulin mu Fc receptor [Gracilinanus agilis]|uniref:high affinity immunoglobulin alpha and immunoglobulin mu Fc receptor n=1 Tax=Gracilinanus agilis TaxID=191870 RepID=UPI001CFD87B5|nr:high affinity immunoglobulin alpha and immunoglobulin mu Fc receptor [Gracilinanus agilis]
MANLLETECLNYNPHNTCEPPTLPQTGEGGTYLRAGWKVIPLFILCLLQATSTLKCPRLVAGDPGGTVTIECHYTPTPANKHQRKYWCRLSFPQRVCHTIISTNIFISQSYKDRVTLVDFPSQGMFVVTLAQLAPEDTGYYRCGIGPRTDIFFSSMNLTISTGSANLTIPSSVIPRTSLATRVQIMEILGTTTSVIGRLELNTTLLAEGWETRTIRRDTTPVAVTQAPGITGATTTVTGGQDLDATLFTEGWERRTRKRENTLAKVTQAPGTIGATTSVTDGQHLDTTLFTGGRETRTSGRKNTLAEVTQAPGIIGPTTTVTSGQVPKTIETITSAPGSQAFDTTLVIKGQGSEICRGHPTPTIITKASENIGIITSVTGRQGSGILGGTIPAAGRRDLDTTLVAKGEEAGIIRETLTLAKVTQPLEHTSSKDIQASGTVRLIIPDTGDWVLKTTRTPEPVPERQTTEAKGTSNITEGGLVLETRAGIKTIVGTVRERRSTIRNVNRLIEATLNTGIPPVTTRNITGTPRPSTTVRDNLREVTPGTDQQTWGTIRAIALDVDVSGWFSQTNRRGKISTLGGTAATDRQNPSEEPLRRIPGVALLIPPSNKSNKENSPPDQRRISQILIIFSTVLLPLVLLVLLLLQRKLQKRISLRTQEMPMLSLIQLTNFQDLPEKLSKEQLQPQEV